MLGLFRIVEAAEGSILIDGIDIAKLGLHQLRNQVGVLRMSFPTYYNSLKMKMDETHIHTPTTGNRPLFMLFTFAHSSTKTVVNTFVETPS